MSSAPNAEQKRRFHWTRFSLRRAFIVCALLCGLLAWFGNVLFQVRREQAALAFLRSKGADVFYKTDALPEGIGSYQRRFLKHLAGYGESRPVNQIGINRLGIDEAASVMARLRYLSSLHRLKHLTLYNTQVTPEGVRIIEQQLPECKVFENAREPVSGRSLQ